MDEYIYMHLQPTRVVTISAQCDCNSSLLVTHLATRWSHVNTLTESEVRREGKQSALGIFQEIYFASQ